MKETSPKTKIMRWLKTIPGSYWEVSPPNSPTSKPDITGCLHGRYVGIEVKVPGKKARRAQSYTLDKLRKAGAACTVATSLTQIKAFIAWKFPIGVKWK